MNEIRDYIIQHLSNLKFIGDLRKEDGFYYFNAEVIEDLEAAFDNKIYEVVSIDYSSLGCYIKLKIQASFLESAIEMEQ